MQLYSSTFASGFLTGAGSVGGGRGLSEEGAGPVRAEGMHLTSQSVGQRLSRGFVFEEDDVSF